MEHLPRFFSNSKARPVFLERRVTLVLQALKEIWEDQEDLGRLVVLDPLALRGLQAPME